MIPRSMLIVIALLAAGFLLSMLGTIRTKSKLPKYRKIGNAPGYNGGASPVSRAGEPRITSYQDSAAVHYALPPQHKKDVTYCVIDGRLVDNP